MKKLLLGISALFMTGIVTAQDVHFTQYFASPLTLNPALTGLVNKDLRVAANYRSQWSSVSSNPYMTGTISFDMATLKGKLPEGDAVGVGALFMYDQSGSGSLQNISFGLSAAYHKSLGYEKNHTISLGVQGLMVQKTIDQSKLIFGDQIDAATGDVGLSNETINNNDLTYPDFNLGLMYSGRLNDNATVYAGASLYHLTTPAETFLDSDTNKIGRRFSAYLGGSFNLNENTVLYTSGLVQTQKKSTEVMLGAAAGFVLNPGYDNEYSKATILYLGSWYRYGDALCPYVGFEWSKMTLGISYDANISKFTAATGGQGAYEFTLIFNGAIVQRNASPRYNFSCPKF